MMRRTLLVLGVLGTVGLLVAAVLGYRISAMEEDRVRVHVYASLASTLIVMFSHTWIVLYLLAVGRVVTQVTEERGGDPEIAERCLRLRRRTTPWLIAALAVVTGAFLAGGVAFSGWLGLLLHQVLGLLAIVLQVVAIRLESRALLAFDEAAAALIGGAEAHAA